MEIAIIGAGAAAVGLLDALPAGAAAAVTVFDPAPLPWRGRPYQPDLESVLVNAPPEIMSIRAGDPAHYARWLAGHGAAFDAYTDPGLGRPLLPRGLYGRYLEDTARAALGRFRDARVVRSAVLGVAEEGGRLVLETAAGTHAADQAVLCVGGGTPHDHYGLAGAPGFVADPYPLERTLADVPAGRDVVVIGTGLTAVDIAVSLAARGHEGRIALASRGGALPFVWQRPAAAEPRHLTAGRLRSLDAPVPLDVLIGLIRAELADRGEDWDALAADIAAAMKADPARNLREQLAAVDAPPMGRRIVQVAAHTVGPLAWRLLAGPDRERLRRGLFRTITAVASPMVPRNAAVLLDLFDSGRLEVLAGLAGIGRDGSGFRVAHAGGVRTADVVINAVNPPPRSVPRAAEPLVASLLAAGAARHPDGGLAADPGTGRLLAGGRPDPRLHLVGDLAGGGSFITSGIPGVAAQAARTAESIAAAARTPA
ncbi:FAD/NAD(P)-binding protein [Actinomadura sp. 21ATH]|uniref:FAD/NAD(P)-binding protein n=1 Tax=Actinomadura sp. 21ATH TaxID=1735444 RepID=UPI0035C08A5F